MGARSTTRVALVEDDAPFAETLSQTLSREGCHVLRIATPRLRTAGAPSRGSCQVVAEVLRATPRIALLDLALTVPGSTTPLVEPLAREGVAVVIIATSPTRSGTGEALRAGARCVLPKNDSTDGISRAVHRIETGLPVMSTGARRSLLDLCHDPDQDAADLDLFEELTTTQAAVLGHLMDGHEPHEIAQLGAVPEATVRAQVTSLLARLRVSSPAAAVGLAHRVGWWPRI